MSGGASVAISVGGGRVAAPAAEPAPGSLTSLQQVTAHFKKPAAELLLFSLSPTLSEQLSIESSAPGGSGAVFTARAVLLSEWESLLRVD